MKGTFIRVHRLASTMRTTATIAAMIALTLLAGPLASTGLSASHDEVVEIELVETGDDEAPYAFEPGEVTVEPGTTVRWVHTHEVFHTVTSTDSQDEKQPNGMFDESMSSEGDTFEYTFEEPGTYHYFCKPHSGFMEGTVHVEGEDGGTDGDTTDAPLGGAVALAALVAATGLLAARRIGPR